MSFILWVDSRPEETAPLRASLGAPWPVRAVSDVDEAWALGTPLVAVQVLREGSVSGLAQLRQHWPRAPRVALMTQGTAREAARAVNEGQACGLLPPDAEGPEVLQLLEELSGQRAASGTFRTAFVESLVDERMKLITRAKREWEQTFDAFSLPVVVLEKQGRVARANRAAARAAGLPITSVPGRPYAQLVYGAEEPPAGCPIARVLAGAEEAEGELPASGGRVLAVRAYRGDAPDLVFCTAEDVTKEKVRLRSAFQVEKMVALGQLAGGVAHEINNPIATILAFTSLLKADTERSPDDLEALWAIEQSAQRCRRIVDNMLRFSRRETKRQTADLSEVVREAAALFQIQAKQHPRVEFELDLAEQLPRLSLNVAQFEQVLLNLLQNALQALPGREGRIAVTTRLAGSSLRLEVRDTGVGIDAADLARIFDAGYTTKAEGEGTGLGLTIVESIIREHGGRVQVESAPGAGTRVSINLPLPTDQQREGAHA